MKDNSGFSLVELIIVISIMAILAAALAPQLMKYIAKSRIATDNSNCETIRSNIDLTFSDIKAFDEVIRLEGSGEKTVTFSFSGSKPTDYNGVSSTGAFAKEFESLMNEWPEVRESSSKVFKVTIYVNADKDIVNKVNVAVEDGTL